MHTCNRSLSPHTRVIHRNHIHLAECTDAGLETKQNWLAISSSSSTVSTYLDDLLLSLLLVATVHSKSFITTPDPSIPTCTYKSTTYSSSPSHPPPPWKSPPPISPTVSHSSYPQTSPQCPPNSAFHRSKKPPATPVDANFSPPQI